MRRTLYFGLAGLLSLPFSSFAELYECGGTWTNKPCEKNARTQLEESKTSDSEIDAKKAQVKKKQIVAEARHQALNVASDHGVSISEVDRLQHFCLKESTPLGKCQKRAEKLTRALSKTANRQTYVKQREELLQNRKQRRDSAKEKRGQK